MSLLTRDNKESSEVSDNIKPGRRVKIKVTGSKMSTTSDDSLFACRDGLGLGQPVVINVCLWFRITSATTVTWNA